MKLKQLFTDDSAVSPVIGVILMVAITVILAAVIGTFVLNLGGNLSDTSPQASFGFDFENDTGVTITHETGDSIEGSQLNTTGISSVSGQDWGDKYPDSNVGAGDSVSLNGSVWSGETIRVVWSSESGETSATLSRTTAPDNT